ncbi:hypothetical protein C664_05241 [Thauera sp. 63]|nr:hypothetical protein C664_05241 [Thauera sp. 63]
MHFRERAAQALERFRSSNSLRKLLLSSLTAPLIVGCGFGGGGFDGVDAQRAKPFQRYDLVQAIASNGVTVVAASQAGSVIVSDDQGRAWRRHAIGGGMVDLATCPDGRFVGIDFQGRGWVGDSKGQQWDSIALSEPVPAISAACDTRGRWWVTGAHAQVAMSPDFGATWTLIDLSRDADDAQLTSIQMVDESHGFIVGEFGFVFGTTDGGENWTHIGTIDGDFYPYAVAFVSREEGFASGLAGQVVRTTDGGVSWAPVPNVTGVSFYRLVRAGNEVFGVGGGGVVARLSESGVTPVAYPDAMPVPLTSVASLGPDRQALVVGGPGGFSRVVSTEEAGS